MDEVKNVTLEDILAMGGEFPVKPRRGRLIVTVNMREDDGSLVLSDTKFDDSQYVLAVSDNITDIKVGDKILLDVEKMMTFVQEDENSHERVGVLKLKPIEVDGIIYALIYDNVVEAIDAR